MIPDETKAGKAFVTRGSHASGHPETSSVNGWRVGGKGEEGSFPIVKMQDMTTFVMCSMENGERDLNDSFRMFSRTHSAEM